MLKNDCSKILSPWRADMRACGGPLDRLDHCIKEKLSLTPSPSLSRLSRGRKAPKKAESDTFVHLWAVQTQMEEHTKEERHGGVFLPVSCECFCCLCANCVGVGVSSHRLLERILWNNEGSLTTPPISIQPWYNQPGSRSLRSHQHTRIIHEH